MINNLNNQNWFSVKEVSDTLGKSLQSIYGRIKRRENKLKDFKVKINGTTYYSASAWKEIILADILIFPDKQKTKIDPLYAELENLKIELKNINKKIDKLYKIHSSQ